MGEKIIDSDHKDNISLRGANENKVSCYENHGGIICSLAFGLYQGGCDYSSTSCMDHNGHGVFSTTTDCNTFILSDCCLSLCEGNCWNEIMQYVF
jgi:hypothetical protein